MNEEEKQAIKDIEKTIQFYNKKPERIIFVTVDNFDVDILKTVLNLITKLQKENELLNEFIFVTGGKDIPKDITATRYVRILQEGYLKGKQEEREYAKKYFNELQEESKEKDKQIDLMEK